VVTNSIVWNNTTGSGSGTNYGGSCTFAYSCTAPTAAGVSNITANPLFVNAGGGNYRLAKTGELSPCLDAGTNLAWMVGALDLAGANRILGIRVNMGAYEDEIPLFGTVYKIR
jgi:hypothetical protein